MQVLFSRTRLRRYLDFEKSLVRMQGTFRIALQLENRYLDTNSTFAAIVFRELCFRRRTVYDSICMLDKIRIARITTVRP